MRRKNIGPVLHQASSNMQGRWLGGCVKCEKRSGLR